MIQKAHAPISFVVKPEIADVRLATVRLIFGMCAVWCLGILSTG